MAVRKRLPRSPIEKDPNRPLIERALAMGVSMQQVGKRYGYSHDAVSRFRAKMPQQLKAAIIGATLKPGIDDLEKLRSDESAGLLGNLAHQRARLLLMQDVCMEEGGVDQVVRLSGVIHRNLEMVGRYLGLFANLNVSTNVNILISEDYLRLRQSLTLALRPFPEARRAVAEELHRIEGEVAKKMLVDAGKPPVLRAPPEYRGGLHRAKPSARPLPATIDIKPLGASQTHESDQPPSATDRPLYPLRRPGSGAAEGISR
jgi:hypothetical protein